MPPSGFPPLAPGAGLWSLGLGHLQQRVLHHRSACSAQPVRPAPALRVAGRLGRQRTHEDHPDHPDRTWTWTDVVGKSDLKSTKVAELRLFAKISWISWIIIYNLFQNGDIMGNISGISFPIGCMYAIYGNICHQYTPNVSIYTIHGSYGYGNLICVMGFTGSHDSTWYIESSVGWGVWQFRPSGSVSLELWGMDSRPAKHTKNYGTSPCFMGKSTISMAMFNSKLLVSGRVYLEKGVNLDNLVLSWWFFQGISWRWSSRNERWNHTTHTVLVSSKMIGEDDDAELLAICSAISSELKHETWRFKQEITERETGERLEGFDVINTFGDIRNCSGETNWNSSVPRNRFNVDICG